MSEFTSGKGFIIDSGEWFSEKEMTEEYEAAYNTFDILHRGMKCIRSVNIRKEMVFCHQKKIYRKVLRGVFFDSPDDHWVDMTSELMCAEAALKRSQPLGVCND